MLSHGITHFSRASNTEGCSPSMNLLPPRQLTEAQALGVFPNALIQGSPMVPHGMFSLCAMSNKPNSSNCPCVSGGLWLKDNDRGNTTYSGFYPWVSAICQTLLFPVKQPWNGGISMIILILKLRTLSSNRISPFPMLHSFLGRKELKFELQPSGLLILCIFSLLWCFFSPFLFL